MSRRAQLAVLARPTVHAVRWEVPAAAGCLAVLLLVWRRSTLEIPDLALWTVRSVLVVLVVGALPLLDDPAARQVAAAPLPLAWRLAGRLGAAWALVVAVAALLAGATSLPVVALVVEAAAVVVLACLASLVLSRWTDHSEPSSVVGMSVLLLAPALSLLPARAAILVPLGPLWADAHVRWAGLLLLGALGTAYALRDPAAPSPKRLWRPSHSSVTRASSPRSDAPMS